MGYKKKKCTSSYFSWIPWFLICLLLRFRDVASHEMISYRKTWTNFLVNPITPFHLYSAKQVIMATYTQISHLIVKRGWERLFIGRLVPFSSAFPGGSVVKNLPANAEVERDVGSIPVLGRSPGDGNGKPLRYSCLENPMDRGAWQDTVHGVTKSQTGLSMHAFCLQSVVAFNHILEMLSQRCFQRL